MDWDDLRFFVEVVRAGSLSRAALRTDVRHTTIARRLRRLEQEIGEPLFVRSREGYRLTRRGAHLWEDARLMDDAVSRIADKIPQQQREISGLVRIGCTEGFGSHVIAPLMKQLREIYPRLTVDLFVQPRPILLTRNEADLVIHIDRPERGPYIVSKITDYSLRPYAARQYLENNAPIQSLDDLKEHPLIDYINENRPARDLPYMETVLDQAKVVLRSTSINAQKQMVLSGAGIAILPDFLIRPTDALVPLFGDDIVFTREFWLIVPDGLHHYEKVRAVARKLKNLVKASRLLGGTQN